MELQFLIHEMAEIALIIMHIYTYAASSYVQDRSLIIEDLIIVEMKITQSVKLPKIPTKRFVLLNLIA